MSSVIMSWSEAAITIGLTGAADALCATLVTIGVIKDKSTTMDSADGNQLKATASGGKLVATQNSDGDVTIKTRVIEPDYELLSTMLDSTLNVAKDELIVKSHVIEEPYSVVVTPKNIGATGVKVRKASVSYKPGFSEEEGHFADFTFTILFCADGEFYTKFKKKIA